MLSAQELEDRFENAVGAARSRRDVVVVDGPDAMSYLHGQLSQNVERLEVGASAWSFLLEPQGRVTAWTRVTRVTDQAYWLDVDPGYGEQMLERLQRFKLRTKADFRFVTAHVVSVRGPESPDVAEVRDRLTAGGDAHGFVVAELSWPGVQGFDILGEEPPPLLDIDEGDASALESLRIGAGIPAMGAELGEKTIPAEVGVVPRSTDFTKGCYVGQELVARIDSRGNNTPRRVLPVTVSGDSVPDPGSEISLNGDPVGVLTSVAGSHRGVVGLASIKRGAEAPFVGEIIADGVSRSVAVSEAHWA